ncbi:MAG: hypothetical protein PHD03_04505 [Bacilli bacterium]|nr:hypothetical protein [Bacilli bacterium]MDD4407004.1 hypothetical protein [Bacilli bacterium]
MNKEEKKVAFDLSVLTLNELVNLYENVTNFLSYLNETKIEDTKEED